MSLQLSVYVGQEIIAKCAFVLFVLSFFVLRLFGLPLLVVSMFIYGCHSRGTALIGIPSWGPTESALASLVILLLMPLHFVWGKIIIGMILRMGADDPRSDASSEEEDTDMQSNKAQRRRGSNPRPSPSERKRGAQGNLSPTEPTSGRSDHSTLSSARQRGARHSTSDDR